MEYQIYTPSAPSHGKAKHWVRNVNIWIIGICPLLTFKNITSPTIMEKILIAREVDSRYPGNKSAYGKAMRHAQEKLQELTATNPTA